MKKTIVALIGIAVVLIVIGLLTKSYTTGQAVREEKTIKIGFIGPFSGDTAIFGEVERNAAEIAVQEINEKGGINGKKIEFIYEDGKCNGKDATLAANKLINIDELKILFVTCSAENIAVAPLAEKNKVIQIAAWANHPDLTHAGDYIFRNAHSDSQTGEIAAQTIYQEYEKIGTIYELTDYSAGLHREFKRNFEKLGGEIIVESFNPGAKDMKTQLTKLLSHNPEAIFLNPNAPIAGIVILKQLDELKFKGKIYGNYFGSSPEVVKMEPAQGMIFFSEPTIKENPIKKKLFEKYKKVYGIDPAFDYPVVSQYDTVYIIANAIDECSIDTECIKDYLYALEDFTGALGTYHFDENGDIFGVEPSILMIKDKEVVPAIF